MNITHKRRQLEEKLLKAVENTDVIAYIDALAGIVNEASREISKAITPINRVNSPALIYALKQYVKEIEEQFPGAEALSDEMGMVFDKEKVKVVIKKDITKETVNNEDDKNR